MCARQSARLVRIAEWIAVVVCEMSARTIKTEVNDIFRSLSRSSTGAGAGTAVIVRVAMILIQCFHAAIA